MQEDARSRMLGTMPMNKLVPKVSVPIMISMTVQALYNVVDSIFISKFNPNGMTAVSLVFPVQMLMVALAVGMGVGVASLMSRKLGEHKPEEARQVSWNGFLVEGCGWLIFATVGLFLAPGLVNLLVQDSLENVASIREMGLTYLSIVTTWSFGLFMSILMERMLQSTGSTVLSMLTQLSGAVTNIVLDPILISGAGMGVRGAAIATVAGQFVAAGVGLTFNQLKNAELRMRLREFRISGQHLRGILAVGAPSTVMQGLGSVMMVGLNAILTGFGNAAVTVLSIYFKLQSFVFMPCFGLGSGMIAIVGYNFGARMKDRVYEAIRVALRYAVIIMAAGTLLFWVIPDRLMQLFEPQEILDAIEETAAASAADGTETGLSLTGSDRQQTSASAGPAMSDEDLLSIPEKDVPEELKEQWDKAQQRKLAGEILEMGPVAMRTISLCFVLAAVGVTLSNVFQAIGKGMYSMFLSICRQLAVLLPSALLLKVIFGSVNAVWWSFVIAEGVSCVICLLMYRKIRRDVIEML